MTAETREPIVLASGSVTRHRLLEAAGLNILVDVPRVDEEEVKRSCRQAGLSAAEVAEALAELKAGRVASRYPGVHVIAADQMLTCQDLWFDKPPDRAHAHAQLTALSGKTHQLISAVVVMHNGARIWHHVDRAEMVMRPLSDVFINNYLDRMGSAALTSVGAYQLEGLGAQLFNRIQGDFFTILGLPLLPLLDFLRSRGVVDR
jgi:septum formation protein